MRRTPLGPAYWTDRRRHASFEDDQRVLVDGRPLIASRFVIATGTVPSVPALDGIGEVGYLTNETIFDLRELPQRLLVLGGGATGVELAQAFRRLGSDVTVVEQLPRLLPGWCEEASAAVEAALAADGVDVRIGVARRGRAARQAGFSSNTRTGRSKATRSSLRLGGGQTSTASASKRQGSRCVTASSRSTSGAVRRWSTFSLRGT
jgi:pyruvate/2-oxoglutarate dehydrogenase complex dihydrolipoamide dehydrogenase (E3) component